MRIPAGRGLGGLECIDSGPVRDVPFVFGQFTVCIALGSFNGSTAAFVVQQGPDRPTASNCKQTESPAARLVAQKFQHRFGVGTGHPFRFRHGFTLSANA